MTLFKLAGLNSILATEQSKKDVLSSELTIYQEGHNLQPTLIQCNDYFMTETN